MVKIVWTKLAIEDLNFIHEYICRDSKFYADRYIDKLINRVDQLENFPRSGRVVPEFNLSTIRELIEGNYRIVYQITPKLLAILRIHHAAKELQEIK
jgi:addiction module RelE/StbE family toxin